MDAAMIVLKRGKPLAAVLCLGLYGAAALAGSHGNHGGSAADRYTGPAPESFYWRHGFEGRLDVLTAALMDAIRQAGPAADVSMDLSPEQQAMLGRSVARVIKTIRNDEPYQHEANDALVKATLTSVQFAKDHGMMEQLIEHEVKVQSPMIERVGRMISEGASPELGIIALTERTACFYHLVEEYERSGLTVRWKSPYGMVLPVSRRIGQFDLTEQEIHETYTAPLLRRQAAVMGMALEVSPWREDGWLSMTIRMPE